MAAFVVLLSAFFVLFSLRKCRAIAKMLTERAILKDALPHDRVLSGAKILLMKYALGSLVKEVIVGGMQKELHVLPHRVARLR